MGNDKKNKALSKFSHDGSLGHLFEMVEIARRVARNSDHAEYKVGVVLHSVGSTKRKTEPYETNWNQIPFRLRTGNLSTENTNGSNPTSHGELMLLKDADPARKNYLACNFPNCPTCTKKAILHGVYAIVMDAHVNGEHIIPRAFDNPKIESRFADGWDNLSLPLLRAAGVHVLGVDPERRKIGIIHHGLPRENRPKLSYLDVFRQPTINIPIEPQITGRRKHAQPRTTHIFSEAALDSILHADLPVIAGEIGTKTGGNVAVVRVRDDLGRHYIIGASECTPPGMQEPEFNALASRFRGSRYTASIDPVIRLIMESARRGFTLEGGRIACNYLPHVGRHIDLVACGVDKMYLPEGLLRTAKRNPEFDMLRTIRASGAITYREVSPERTPPSYESGLLHGPPRPPEF